MNARLAYIVFVDGGGPGIDNSLPQPPNVPGYPLPTPPGFGGGPVDPGYGRPGWSPVDPGYGQGHPRPPHAGWPSPPNYPTTGPVFPPVTIDNTLPEGTPPPSISLPIVLPPEINPEPPDPDRRFELKYSARYGWVLVPVSDDEAEPK